MTDTNTAEMADKKGLYELGFIVDPGVAEEEAPALLSVLIDIIETKGGTIVSHESPKLIDLAYTIMRSVGGKREKFDKGYFGHIKFEAAGESPTEIDKAVKAESRIIRHILIHTVKLMAQAPKARSGSLGPKPSEEELNREVDQLIAATEVVEENKEDVKETASA